MTGGFHLTKRDGISRGKAVLIRLVAVLLSLIVCGLVIMAITGDNPVEVYAALIDGAVGSKNRLWNTIRSMMLLLIVAVGLTPAFKMRFWNIGAEGQILVGGIAAAGLMIYGGGSLPGAVLIPLILIVSTVSGLLWGLIPAFFKAYFNTNETLFTLMLNYVAIQLTNFAIILWESPKGSNSVGVINQASKAGWFPKLFGANDTMIVLLVLLVTVLMAVYLRYSKQGYEIAVVGESRDTARYAGINVKKVILRTMMISGGICGLAGAIIVCGASHTISTGITGGRGFTAIIVAWMSHFNALAMALVSAFLGFMQQGAIQIATQFGLNENASEIITGIILFFLIGSEFFINYRIGRKGGGKG
ncbi:MAG: ABC transporter permease [Lachnospiraceae bacterium]|nr:ABC transporter permease [Lachnospiraceae bacterium]MBR0093417.1 ABC transporter permease [Lachnospiraceae bacterium]